MNRSEVRKTIEEGDAVLGIELGSTRIKAVLLGPDYETAATGNFSWENHLDNNVWTYPLEEVWEGVQGAYRAMAEEVYRTYGVHIRRFKSMGFSGMMHGYLAFDREGGLLVPFRTWRNTTTGEAAEKLTALFSYNVPQRWSIAHLYQAMLDREPHVERVDYVTTLAGYIHWKLTGRKVLGIGEASGMFPIDIGSGAFYPRMIGQFNVLAGGLGMPWKLEDILPKVLKAGEHAGCLTEEGARLLDPAGNLEPGTILCPPEGDAGTGMVATGSVAPRTGNISAGTSIFAMIVLEKELSAVYPEIDMVTTPSGELVAMAHANNCTSDLNAWVGIFGEFAREAGMELDDGTLYRLLYNMALKGDKDCGKILSYGFLSGENILPLNEGRPLLIRTADSHFSLANLMRANLSTAFGAIKIGLDILVEKEQVRLDEITGHGGIFKTKGVAQKIMAAALNTPVCVMKTAGEGGAWGIAVLAAYRADRQQGESLAAFLENRIFIRQEKLVEQPDEADVEGFSRFMERYKEGMEIEYSAIKCLTCE